jgi:hypothetical protein
MERIITSRLEGYVETNDILDEEQEGFWHYRSTTNALSNLTQSIVDGFNEEKFTLAVLISCNNVAPVTNLCLGRATTQSHSSQWSKKKVAVET